MSSQPSPYPGQPVGQLPDDWQRRAYHPPAESSAPSLGVPGWAIAGLAAAAVGVWAWYAFGPDFQRYMKIRSM
jgi:hypothetical protein